MADNNFEGLYIEEQLKLLQAHVNSMGIQETAQNSNTRTLKTTVYMASTIFARFFCAIHVPTEVGKLKKNLMDTVQKSCSEMYRA